MAVHDRPQPLHLDASRPACRARSRTWSWRATSGLSEQVERRAELRDLVLDLGRLPENQRAALVLFEVGGLSQAEIGDVLDVHAERVKALVFQARTA